MTFCYLKKGSSDCGDLSVAMTEAPVSTEAGGVTTTVETYDLVVDFPDSGGNWAGHLVFSHPVTPGDTVALKSEVKCETLHIFSMTQS